MTREEKANLKQNAREVAEKVKTLTVDKVSLENYEDYRRYRWSSYGDVLSQYKAVKKAVVGKGLAVVAGFIGMAIAFPIMFALNVTWLAVLAGISLGTAGFAGISLVDDVPDLAKLNSMEVVAVFKELKKQNLLGKLDEVFKEYESSERLSQDRDARREENERQKNELLKQQLERETTVTERQVRLLPKLLQLLKENNAQSLYEVRVDAQNNTATVRAADGGRPIGEVSSNVRRLIENGVEVNFED